MAFLKKIDILLGTEVFSRAVLHNRQFGPKNYPSTLETCFSWVLSGEVHVHAQSRSQTSQVTSCCALSISGDELLRKFLEVEGYNYNVSTLSMDEKAIVRYLETTHKHDSTSRCVIMLHKKLNIIPLGKSRTQTVTIFLELEYSLKFHAKVQDFANAIS